VPVHFKELAENVSVVDFPELAFIEIDCAPEK
jgi:hypothetical protein